MRSLLQRKEDGQCYLCLHLMDDAYRKGTVEHHIYEGTGRRKLSEQYGMKVYLCPGHHNMSNESVHMNPNGPADTFLKRRGQQAFEKEFPELGREGFRQIFGRSYL